MLILAALNESALIYAQHWTPSKTMLHCCAFTFVIFRRQSLVRLWGFFAIVITLEVFAGILGTKEINDAHTHARAPSTHQRI